MHGVQRPTVVHQDFHILRECVPRPQVPEMPGSNLAKALMDFFTLSFFVLNALSRPRSVSQRLMDILIKDGITFLLVR